MKGDSDCTFFLNQVHVSTVCIKVELKTGKFHPDFISCGIPQTCLSDL